MIFCGEMPANAWVEFGIVRSAQLYDMSGHRIGELWVFGALGWQLSIKFLGKILPYIAILFYLSHSIF